VRTPQDVAEIISQEAKNNNISVSKLVAESYVGKSFVDNLKKGREPSVFALAKVANYLGVSTDYLLGNFKVDDSQANDSFDTEKSVVSGLVDKYDLDEVSEKVLGTYVELSGECRDEVNRFLRLLSMSIFEKNISILHNKMDELIIGTAIPLKVKTKLSSQAQHIIHSAFPYVADFGMERDISTYVARSDDYITPQLTPEEEKRIEDAPGDDAF